MVYNVKKNFLSIKFKQYIKLIAISIKKVLIKAYNSIGKIENTMFHCIKLTKLFVIN